MAAGEGPGAGNLPPKGTAVIGGAWLPLTLFVLYLAIAEPWIGVRMYRRLAAHPTPEAKLRFYRTTIGLEWGLVAATVAVAEAGGLTLADFGVTWPHRPASPIVTGIAVGATAGAAAGAMLAWALQVRGAARRTGGRLPVVGDVRALLPATPLERRWMAAVALTAGACEEFLFRGLLHGWLQVMFPALPVFAVVAIGALVFGTAHVYQGWAGVAATALLGAILAAIRVATGSLLVPVLVHALMDLRAALTRWEASAHGPPAA